MKIFDVSPPPRPSSRTTHFPQVKREKRSIGRVYPPLGGYTLPIHLFLFLNVPNVNEKRGAACAQLCKFNKNLPTL